MIPNVAARNVKAQFCNEKEKKCNENHNWDYTNFI